MLVLQSLDFWGCYCVQGALRETNNSNHFKEITDILVALLSLAAERFLSALDNWPQDQTTVIKLRITPVTMGVIKTFATDKF